MSDEDDRSVGGGETNNANPSVPRKRQYPSNFPGPFCVFIRDAGVGLPHLKISRYLHEKYKSITSLTKLNKAKFRIMLNDINEANSIPHDKTLENCRAYIPAKSVEVDGVVHIPDFTVDEETVISFGKGRFRASSLHKLDVIDAFRFSKTEMVGEVATKVNSVYMRVTFPGTVLPDQLDLDGLLISVTKCKEKIMVCKKCLKYGHTSQFCNGTPRCQKCGESHDGANCRLAEFKCPNCKHNHSKLTECEAFKKLRYSTEKQAKRRLNISYAQATQNWTSFNFQLQRQDKNPYAILAQENDTQTNCEQTPNEQTICTNKDKKPRNQPNVVKMAVNPTKKRRMTTPIENEEEFFSVPSTSGVKPVTGTKSSSQPLPITRTRIENRQNFSSPPANPTPEKQPVAAIESNLFFQPMARSKKRLNNRTNDQHARLTPFGGLISTVCDLFKISPEIKNLVLSLLVPIIEQIWPSISTLKMPVINLASHG
jgi:hypothetical protein